MTRTQVTMQPRKKIALIAHDGMKPDLLEWVDANVERLAQHDLFATGTTGKYIQERTGLNIYRFESGPLGGDQQIGARIVEGLIDMLIFFWDPLEPQPHDPDVKALLRIAVLHNIPTASNRSSADFLLTSDFIDEVYQRVLPDYSSRIRRPL